MDEMQIGAGKAGDMYTPDDDNILSDTSEVAQPKPQGRSLEHLGLPLGTREKLEEKGYYFAEQLQNVTEEELLRSVDGLGVTKVDFLKTQLHKHGFKLKGEPEFRCPVKGCDRPPFASKMSLAQHTSQTHGIPGKDKEKAWYKKLHPGLGRKAKRASHHDIRHKSKLVIETRNIKAKGGRYFCPECTQEGVRKFYNDTQHLGYHRRTAHGVIGTFSKMRPNKMLKLEFSKKTQHWTQKPENKKKVQEHLRKMKLGRDTHSPTKVEVQTLLQEADSARTLERAEYRGYLIGTTFAHIKDYLRRCVAESGGAISEGELTSRMAELLVSAKSG